jgi:putative transposase
MSFNGRRDHHGTMFEGRYHGRNHKPEPEVMWKTSAYIDINAWEAGIVERPEDYEWCSFAAASGGVRDVSTAIGSSIRSLRP